MINTLVVMSFVTKLNEPRKKGNPQQVNVFIKVYV